MQGTSRHHVHGGTKSLRLSGIVCNQSKITKAKMSRQQVGWVRPISKVGTVLAMRTVGKVQTVRKASAVRLVRMVRIVRPAAQWLCIYPASPVLQRLDQAAVSRVMKSILPNLQQEADLISGTRDQCMSCIALQVSWLGWNLDSLCWEWAFNRRPVCCKNHEPSWVRREYH